MFKYFPVTLLDFSRKFLVKNINCGTWSKKFNVKSPHSFPSKKVEFEKISPKNVDALGILVGENIRGHKKLELRLTIKLSIESEILYFDKSMLKPRRKKIILDDSFCNFSNNGEIKSFLKSFIVSLGYLYMERTITLFDFEYQIFIKVDSIFSGS